VVWISLLPLLALGPVWRAPEIIPVGASADLQPAIDRARPGDTLALAAGTTFVGNFILPDKGALPDKRGEAFITIRTAGPPDGLPRPGERIQPAHAPRLAKLRSPNRQPALATAAGAHHWRLELLEFLPNEDGFGDIITLGDGGPAQSRLEQVPHALVVDRCYIHGDPVKGQKRAVALNSASTTIVGSYIAEVKAVGQDSQAIGGWNGPGPYTIENNYLEGAGENFLLGGADPAIHGLVTEDVIFRGNHLAKPLDWRTARWQVKNLFELKNARRVLVEGNVMEHVWKDAQAGYAILLTPRNQDGAAPWVRVEDVTIRGNIIRHAGGGLQITGEDSNHPGGSTRGIRIVDNLFHGIDGERWGGPGVFVLIGNGPEDIAIEHNTISQSGNLVSAYGGSREKPTPVRGFVFRGNLARHNAYGVHGADRAPGQDTLKTFFPGAVFEDNALAGGDATRYPRGNLFLAPDEFDRQFVDPAAGEFRLKPDSRFRGAVGGRDLGANVEGLRGVMRGGSRVPEF
jgi:hypothetical protein